MQQRFTLIVLILVAVSYVVALYIIDSERSIFSRLSDVAGVLPVLLAASLTSYALRAARWLQLLAQLGHRVRPAEGALGYIAGFAFTASPGKAGELIRIRYLAHTGVAPADVIAAFVFERVLDLVSLLLFASLLARSAVGFGFAALFVALVLATIVVLARNSRRRLWIQYSLRRLGMKLAARAARAVLRGIEKTTRFLKWRSILPAGVLGLAAWGAQCSGYAMALAALGIDLPAYLLFSIPAAAILIGAASLLPGGIGTTEAATVILLTQFGSDLDTAILASITLRLGSIWFATALGFVALTWLEFRYQNSVFNQSGRRESANTGTDPRSP